jgi:3-oxoacyl-[acyl-carrier protein] reductase
MSAPRGLGSAIALEQAAAGSNVAVNYFNSSDAAERLCERIEQAGGQARAFKADVRNEGEIARMVREVEGVFGGIDILVVNATGPQPFLSIEEQTWELTWACGAPICMKIGLSRWSVG